MMHQNQFSEIVEENFGFKEILTMGVLLLPMLLGALDLSKVNNGKDLRRELIVDIRKNDLNSSFYKFMHAVCEAESNFDEDATSKDGGAYGLFQFRKIAIKDINLQLKKNYTIDDAYNPKVAPKMFMDYCSILINRFNLKNGRNPTYRELAMMYHGGTNAYKAGSKYHSQALKYANKVAELMDNL